MILPGLAHMMMLERQWERAARALSAWLANAVGEGGPMQPRSATSAITAVDDEEAMLDRRRHRGAAADPGATRVIAVVGLSAQWHRPSYFAAKYMKDHGYRIIPVNPSYAEVLGEKCYPSVAAIPEPVDIVDCFRKPGEIVPIAHEAIAKGAKVLWMQLGIRNDEAARIAAARRARRRDEPLRQDRACADPGRAQLGRREHRRDLGQAARADVTLAHPAMPDRKFGFDTLCLHAGQIPDAATGARALPIYQTTSFVFDSADHAASLFNLQTFGNVYSRISNPTVAALEERVAALEGGRAALAAATGMAAQMLALLTLCHAGDHIVASRTLYGGTYSQLAVTFAQFGIEATFVDADDPDAFRRALQAADQGALRRDDRQSAAQRLRHRARSPRSRTTPAFRS